MKIDFNTLIHSERTKLIGLLPKNAEVFCSAGCAGAWYFDWIEKAYGAVKLHVGVELYSPEPAFLPSNVKWIANSASNMHDVESSSVDILFSGQNLEHLYAFDMKGFFKEANRVLRQGGTLCIDSPNRSVTQPGRYIQQEHVLELTVQEAVHMTQLAGFKVDGVYGILLCENGSIENYEITNIDDDILLKNRIGDAYKNPKESFIWWLISTKIRPFNIELNYFIDQIFLKDFPGFVRSRFTLLNGVLENATGTEAVIKIKPSDNGFVFYGPYVPLVSGAYFAEFLIRPLCSGGELVLDVVSSCGKTMHAQIKISLVDKNEWQSVRIPFSIQEYTTGIETRVFSNSAAALIRFGSQIISCND